VHLVRIYAIARTVDNDLTKVIRRVFTAWLAAEGKTTGSKPLQDIAWTKRKINKKKTKTKENVYSPFQTHESCRNCVHNFLSCLIVG